MKHDTRLRKIMPDRVKEVIEIARAADIDVAGFEVAPDGTIRILGAGAFPGAPKDEFEEWEQKRRSRQLKA